MKSSSHSLQLLLLVLGLLPGAVGTTLAGAAVVRGDFDNDGDDDAFVVRNDDYCIRPDVALAGASVEVISFITAPLYLNPDTVKTADLDQDGFDDILLASRAANRLLVIHGQANLNDPFRTDEFTLAGGPVGADAGQYAGADALEIMAVLSAQVQPGLAMLNGAGSTLASYALPSEAGSWNSLDVRSASLLLSNPLPQFAWLSKTNGGPEQIWWADFAIASPGAPPALAAEYFQEVSGLSSGTQVGEYAPQRLLSGFLLGSGTNGHWIVLPAVSNVVAIIPASVAPLSKPTVHREPLGFVANGGAVVPDAGGDLIVAVAADGTFAGLFRWKGPGQLAVIETIPAPTGHLLSQALPLMDGNILMAVGGIGEPPGSVTAFAHYDRTLNRYTYTEALPAKAGTPQSANVMVFDRDPFSGDALEWESFALAGWALNAAIKSGDVLVEYQADPGLPGGLGESTTTTLGPRRTLPSTAVALANQWEPDSSVFFAVPPVAPGGAGVSAEPPPGSYGSPINVSFTAVKDVSVHFRLGNGTWQDGRGPVAVSQTTRVEYYGVTSDGYAGPISQVHYAIGEAGSQLPGNLRQDSDGNGLDDAWERLFFGDIGVDPHGDPDNDLFTSGEEYESGSNPRNSLSVPPGAPGDYRRVVATINPDGTFLLRLALDTGRDAVPEYSEDATTWFPFTEPPQILPDGSREWTDPEPSPGMRLYRITFPQP